MTPLGSAGGPQVTFREVELSTSTLKLVGSSGSVCGLCTYQCVCFTHMNVNVMAIIIMCM